MQTQPQIINKRTHADKRTKTAKGNKHIKAAQPQTRAQAHARTRRKHKQKRAHADASTKARTSRRARTHIREHSAHTATGTHTTDAHSRKYIHNHTHTHTDTKGGRYTNIHNTHKHINGKIRTGSHGFRRRLRGHHASEATCMCGVKSPKGPGRLKREGCWCWQCQPLRRRPHEHPR